MILDSLFLCKEGFTNLKKIKKVYVIESESPLILPLHSDETMSQWLAARNRLGDSRTVPGPQEMWRVVCWGKPLRLATGM